MMHTIPIDEAQARLPELFDEVSDGNEVVITRPDGVAMRLVPVEVHGIPRFGSGRGMFTMADDFDAPLEDFEPYER
jgi:antitoxin (DNA-binding transcriptional repressor) of toxin-antitoxin stability system